MHHEEHAWIAQDETDDESNDESNDEMDLGTSKRQRRALRANRQDNLSDSGLGDD